MSATTRDIFGAASDAQPAVPGSYGEAPRGFRLPDATRLGRVRLAIANLERSLAFYQDALGLRVVEQEAGRAALAAHGDDSVLVELEELPGALPAGRRARLGLFHFAILLPDRASLGRLARHLAESGVPLGEGDHLVSEAFYLSDPDGLGIEVYADRPRRVWRRVARELMISTEQVDIADLMRAAGEEPWAGMPAGTAIGHVHLHVGDLEQASAFFSDALGFDRITWSYPGALFLGAGGYHHHLGTNTWAGAAPPADEADARLLEWTIELPDAESVAAAARSLADAGHPAAPANEGAIVTRDPWGTAIRIRVRRSPGTEAGGEAKLSLVHVVRPPSVPPAAGERAPLLILLHGVGANERQMAALAPALDPRFIVVSVRSPLELGANAYGWFHVTFTPQGSVIVEEEARAGWESLPGFAEEAVAAYGADPGRVYVGGFSQGGIMALAGLLTAPQRFAGAVCMSGRLLPEVLPYAAPAPELGGRPVLIVHGQHDPVLGIHLARSAREQVERLPLALTYRELPMGHEVTPESLAAVSAWLTSQLDESAPG